MFRSMYVLSLSAALGLTENCSTIIGQTAPTSTDERTSRATAIAGIRRSRVKIAAKKAKAQMIAMDINISFAGSTAMMSVYPGPVNVGSLRPLESNE